jgi:protein O-mannosyl-transferase
MSNKINATSPKQIFIVCIILTLATLAVFWQVNHYYFISLDDYVYVKDNSHIQSGINVDGIRWAFSTTYAEFWHPLTWLSLMFDYQLHGLNPGGYHLTNLILHILSTLLLFWLFNRMTGAVWKSAFVAAFFALHPLHVESVAWVSERKDVLSALFWMLTLCLYVYYTEKPVIQRYWLVMFSFVCALMSKPMVVTLPVIMILLDYWPLNRFESKKDHLILWQLKEKLPFFILSAVFSILALHAHYIPSRKYFPLSSRFANAIVSSVTYLEKTFWPHNLAISYPFSDQLQTWQIVGSFFIILVISTVIIVMVKRFPYLFVGWFWYAITILPVIGIIQIGRFAMADRYYYLPSIGIAVIMAWGFLPIIKSEFVSKNILFHMGVMFILIMSFIAWKQCGYWRNSIELFKHTIQVTKNNALAHNSIAPSLIEEGQINSAFYHYNEAIRINPDYADAYNNRGNAYSRLGKYQQAIEDYNEAIRLKPDYADAYYNRGLAYFIQGNYNLGCVDAKKACESGICKILEIATDRGLCR